MSPISSVNEFSPFISLARYDRYAIDTETKGEGRNVIPVGCSIATPDGHKRYMRWGHEAGGNNCTLQEFLRWAKVELSKTTQQEQVFFNAPYDVRGLGNIGVKLGGIIQDAGIVCFLLNEYEESFGLDGLSKKYLHREKSGQPLYDRLAAAFGGKATRKAQAKNIWRGSGDWAEEYAEDDSDLTLSLFDARIQGIWDQGLLQVYQLETMLIPVLDRMYRAGVRIDVDRAHQVQRDMRRELQEVTTEWDKLTGGIGFGERSKLIPFLLDMGVKLPRTAKGQEKFEQTGIDAWGQYSVAKEVLMAIDHPVGGMIRRMRQLSHYEGTFIQSYLLDNVDDLGFIFPQFHQVKRSYGESDDETGTITGRFSSSGGLNAQNIPARDDVLAPLIRSMFIPMDEDSDWLKADYQAIEYRLFAHYAGGQLRQSYIDNPYQDLHQWCADLLGLSARYGPKKGRTKAKTVNFAKIYGAGVEKMALTLGVSLEEAQELVDMYNDRIPEANKLYHKAMNRASVRGYITTWTGRRLRFMSFGEKRKRYWKTYTALNKICQGGSADLTKMAMVEVDQLIDWNNTKMHLTVHDELDFSIPKGSVGLRVTKDIQEVMEHCAEFTVPIIADMKIGPNWGHAEGI